VLLSPLLLGIAIVTLFLSHKSPLIAHRRVGQYGSELWVLKFRTMWERAEVPLKASGLFSIEFIDDEVGPGRKGPEDTRVGSRFARFCRLHSLDELPQIFHVLEGRMSLVGPRPMTRAEVGAIYGVDAVEILHSKPGLAGLWQVSGRNRLSSAERRALDLEWVRSKSPALYVEVLLRTIPEVLFGGDTW
jgi:exopolysaccharide production protein ExoY